MNKKLLVLIATFALLLIPTIALAGDGFDEFGYNETARIFNGPADGVDRILDGAVWGDAYYANDHLKMKWTADWERGNDEGWANPPYDKAWTDNQWNGMVPGGSGENWHYRIKWIGNCTDYETQPDGGYCIWGQFEVIMDHGTLDGAHLWYAHAIASGY